MSNFFYSFFQGAPRAKKAGAEGFKGSMNYHRGFQRISKWTPICQSQRDWSVQPRVARNELPWVHGERDINPERVGSSLPCARPAAMPLSQAKILVHTVFPTNDHLGVGLVQPLQGCELQTQLPRVGLSESANPGLNYSIPSGLFVRHSPQGGRARGYSIEIRREPS